MGLYRIQTQPLQPLPITGHRMLTVILEAEVEVEGPTEERVVVVGDIGSGVTRVFKLGSFAIIACFAYK